MLCVKNVGIFQQNNSKEKKEKKKISIGKQSKRGESQGAENVGAL